MKKIKKIIALILGVLSLSTLYTVNANAAWVKDSYGWWNTEGNSWSIGWKLIDGEWYYFDSEGYMKTGWLLDSSKWYYLNSDGTMAKNTFRCPWQKAKILDSNEDSAVEENEYLIYFLGECNDLRGVTVDKDTLEPTSFWDID